MDIEVDGPELSYILYNESNPIISPIPSTVIGSGVGM